MKQYTKILFSSIFSGVLISLGGTIFLSSKSISLILAGFLFAFGLFIIITLKMHLYTGKIGYVLENKPSYLLELLIVLVGNAIGTISMGYMLRACLSFNDTRLLELINSAEAVSNTKLSTSLLTSFILSILCGFMIYLAVEVSRREVHQLVKIVAIFFAVAIFVICGMEHCIANMFYFSLANAWSADALLYLLVMIVGNAIGSILLYIIVRLAEGKKIIGKN